MRHLPHYASLIGMFAVAFIGFLTFSYDRDFQIAIIIGAATGYIAWGVVHHSLHKDLSLEVFLEYLIFAVVGLVLVLSLVV